MEDVDGSNKDNGENHVACENFDNDNYNGRSNKADIEKGIHLSREGNDGENGDCVPRHKKSNDTSTDTTTGSTSSKELTHHNDNETYYNDEEDNTNADTNYSSNNHKIENHKDANDDGKRTRNANTTNENTKESNYQLIDMKSGDNEDNDVIHKIDISSLTSVAVTTTITTSMADSHMDNPTNATTLTKENQDKKRKKPEMNPDFKDVQESRNRRQISKLEIIIILVLVIIIFVGVVVALIFLVVLPKDTITTTVTTTAISHSQPHVPIKEKLDVIFDILEDYNLVTIPQQQEGNRVRDERDYIFLAEEINKTEHHAPLSPLDSAIFWTLVDETPESRNTDSNIDHGTTVVVNNGKSLIHREALQMRLGLATIYYHYNGNGWYNTTNWLTNAHACEWYGIVCNSLQDRILQIYLSKNNLVGTSLPMELMLLPNLQSLSLSNNHISGTIPPTLFGTTNSSSLTQPSSSSLSSSPSSSSVPFSELIILHLQNNQFTGTIPSNLLSNGILSMLYMHGNQFNGFVPFCDGMNRPEFLREFGVDCNRTICECCTDNNCF